MLLVTVILLLLVNLQQLAELRFFIASRGKKITFLGETKKFNGRLLLTGSVADE